MNIKNDTLINNGWRSKTVRIKLDYNKLCSFLSYQFNEDTRNRVLFDDILNKSLDMILEKNGIGNIEMKNYHGRRYPKGFLLQKSTIKRIENEYINMKKYFAKKDINLSVGEFYELLIYIYCMKNLEENIFNMLEVEWGFTGNLN